MTIDKIRELVEHETGYDLTDKKRTREKSICKVSIF